jgi:hypothetical protein
MRIGRAIEIGLDLLDGVGHPFSLRHTAIPRGSDLSLPHSAPIAIAARTLSLPTTAPFLGLMTIRMPIDLGRVQRCGNAWIIGIGNQKQLDAIVAHTCVDAFRFHIR